jgi:hypothetical protein
MCLVNDMWSWFFDISEWSSALTNYLLMFGMVLYVVSKLPIWIAQLKLWRLPVEIAAVVAFALGSYLWGGTSVEHKWQARVTELEQKLQAAEQRSQEVNTVIQERVVEKIKVIKQNVYVNQEIIRETAGAQLDANCSLPKSSIVLHDSASQNQVPDRAAATDGTPSGIEASRLLETVIENYGACHENAERLRALQQWYLEQKAIFESAQQ